MTPSCRRSKALDLLCEFLPIEFCCLLEIGDGLVD